MRIDYREVFPEALRAMSGLEGAVRESSLEPELLGLQVEARIGDPARPWRRGSTYGAR
jgi:hypothetical protein